MATATGEDETQRARQPRATDSARSTRARQASRPLLHWPEYGAEAAGTFFLIFVGLSAVVFDMGAGSPVARLIPDASWRLLLTGLIFAGSGSLVAISPLGKLSGAHINPSVSLAFWLHGKLRTLDFAGYVVGQFLGAIIGAALLALVWGPHVTPHATSVHNGATLPNPAFPLWTSFAAEAAMTFLLVLLIFIFVSDQRLMRWTPLMTWILVATLVWREAPLSGTSLNPARSVGPALIAHLWTHQWLYVVAPPLGAALAVAAFRFLSQVAGQGASDVVTGKLFHVPNYRSVFTHVSAPSLPHDGKLRTHSASPRGRGAEGDA